MAENEGTNALQAVLEHIATDPEFRKRLEQAPLETLDEFGVHVDDETRAALAGKRFSEFVGATQAPDSPGDRPLTPAEIDLVVGGFAPPYVPVGMVKVSSLTHAWSELLRGGRVEKFES